MARGKQSSGSGRAAPDAPAAPKQVAAEGARAAAPRPMPRCGRYARLIS